MAFLQKNKSNSEYWHTYTYNHEYTHKDIHKHSHTYICTQKHIPGNVITLAYQARWSTEACDFLSRGGQLWADIHLSLHSKDLQEVLQSYNPWWASVNIWLITDKSLKRYNDKIDTSIKGLYFLPCFTKSKHKSCIPGNNKDSCHLSQCKRF